MSRSYWKTPIKANCGQNCSKQWRSKENRKYRAYAKNLMRHELYDNIDPYCNRFGNKWDSPGDGKSWCGNIKYRKCPYIRYMFHGVGVGCTDTVHFCHRYYDELMRK